MKTGTLNSVVGEREKPAFFELLVVVAALQGVNTAPNEVTYVARRMLQDIVDTHGQCAVTCLKRLQSKVNASNPDIARVYQHTIDTLLHELTVAGRLLTVKKTSLAIVQKNKN